MMQIAHDKVRKTIEMDCELAEIIDEMAKNKKWSFSKMSYVLLHQAVKEKIRKSKTAKEDHT